MGGVTFGGPTAPAGGSIYATFLEALEAFLGSDSTLTAAFTAGAWNNAAPTTVDPPFLAFLKASTDRKNTVKAGYSVEKVTVHFVTVGPSARAAESLAATLRGRLLPTLSYTPTPLSSADAAELPAGRYVPGDETTTLDPTRGAYNVDVFTAFVPIVFRLARGGT
jgi:hypothetical protein